MIEVTPEIREFLLALADDEHLMGQQHTEWIGVGPFLEEDLAFSSIGQDELGHAALLYALLVGDEDLAIDHLALQRDPEDYRSCWLTERANGDWAEAMIRHWLHDSIEQHRWELLTGSSIPELADLAVRVQREEAFHIRHADGMLDVLLADAEARPRLLAALADLLPLAVGVFEGAAGEAAAVADGVASGPLSDRLSEWQRLADERFGGLEWDRPAPPQAGRTARSADFGPLMARMREVIDLDPEAIW